MFARSPALAVNAADIVLAAAPIPADWVVSGAPQARSGQLAASRDADSFTCMWDCTAGVFRWYFDCDETVHIVEGGVTVRSEDGTFDLKAGDTAYFPAGTDTLWTVDSYVRKVAFLRLPPPRPISLALRALRKLKRMTGLGPQNAGALTSRAA